MAGVPSELAALQAEVDALWARTGRGPATRLLSAEARQEAHWYVEASGPRFRFVQWERGREEPLTEWLACPEAAHWVLARMVVGVAQAEERRERRRGAAAYSRWNWIAPAIDLMAQVSPAHGAALAREYDEVLARAPLSEAERRAARWPLPA